MFIALVAFLIFADQITKYYIEQDLTTSFPVINGFLYLTYVENKGAAFGIMQNKQIIIVALTAAVFICILCYWLKNRRNINTISKIALSFIVAGATGNLIDRIRYGHVIDFINVKLFNFPVFNISDILLVLGCLIMCERTLRNKI